MIGRVGAGSCGLGLGLGFGERGRRVDWGLSGKGICGCYYGCGDGGGGSRWWWSLPWTKKLLTFGFVTCNTIFLLLSIFVIQYN